MNVYELAARQYGVISRAQARTVMSSSAVDRRIANGHFVVVHPAVYRIRGAPVTGRQRAMAATPWGGDTAVVSHSTGARLLRLDAIPASDLHLTVNRRGLESGVVVVHGGLVSRADRVTVDGIPCTSATRTLIDCAPFVDGETLETAFELARRMGLTSIRAVEQRIGRARPGTTMMRDVLRHAAVRPKESRLEVKFARLLRSSALPRPQPQIEIGEYRVDYLWPRYKAVCECDGFEWHGSRLQWKRDRRRIAAIEAAGYRVTHVTWDDVTKYPTETLARIGRTLRTVA
jgi:very-short-patch-repair endonuclease